jgi:hypothetical protein
VTIDLDAVLHKTEKGRAEIESRAHGLSMGVRRVLILVDGRLRAAQILAKIGLTAETQEALERLLREGFIGAEGAAAGPALAAPRAAGTKAALIGLAQALLGAEGSRVVRKLEETDDTPQALSGALASCEKLIRLTIDERKAGEFAQQAAAIVARARP